MYMLHYFSTPLLQIVAGYAPVLAMVACMKSQEGTEKEFNPGWIDKMPFLEMSLKFIVTNYNLCIDQVMLFLSHLAHISHLAAHFCAMYILPSSDLLLLRRPDSHWKVKTWTNYGQEHVGEQFAMFCLRRLMSTCTLVAFRAEMLGSRPFSFTINSDPPPKYTQVCKWLYWAAFVKHSMFRRDKEEWLPSIIHFVYVMLKVWYISVWEIW